MLKNYPCFSKTVVLPVCLFLSWINLYSQVVTQTYSYTGSVQTFTVPSLCVPTITIEAKGAAGGAVTVNCSVAGGLGASVKGVFTPSVGLVYSVMVGQAGFSNGADGGGGGGSFVSTGTVPVIVAGGGGGASNNIGLCGSNLNGGDGFVTGEGGGSSGNGLISGGSNGNGGGASNGSGGGGGGFYTNGVAGTGTSSSNGKAFLNGGAGGTGNNNDHGGYGGGGAGWHTGGNGGGGGGYSGGGTSGAFPYTGGGGGSSYNSGINQVNITGVQSGNGVVIITYIPGNPGTPVSINPSTLTICTGSSVTLSTSGTLSYTWSTGSQSPVITVSPTVTTAYSVQALSASGCPSSSSVLVTVHEPPTVTVTSSYTGSGVCPNNSVILTGSGASSYTWTSGVSNGVSFIPTASVTSYTVTGTNSCGNATAAITVTVPVQSIPSVTATASSASLCSGSSLTLTAQGNATSYTWAPAGITNGVGFSPGSTASYTVIGASASGCTAMATTSVIVVNTPTAPPAASPLSFCIGGSSTLTANGAANYNWMPGNLNSPTIAVTPGSTTTYTLTKSNANCIDVSLITVTVNQLPGLIAITAPTLVCVTKQATLTAAGALSYTWSPGNVIGTNAYVSPQATTVYTVTGFDGNCKNTTTVAVAVNPNPTISIVASSSAVCIGNSSTLTLNGGTNYTWTPGTLSGTMVVVNPTTPTLYSVIGENALGCTSSASQIMLVNTLPVIGAGTNKPLVCPGGLVTLTATGGNTYNWSNGALTATVVVNPLTSTVYTVTGYNTSTGCQNTKTVQVSVLSSSVTIQNPGSVCAGGIATLSASGASSYTWNGSVYSAGMVVSPTVATIYTLSATSSSLNVNCISTNTVSVFIHPNPTVIASSNQVTVCKGEKAILSAAGASTYAWSNSLTGTPVQVIPPFQTTYTVTGTDVNGCKNTATVTVKVVACTGIEEITDTGGPDVSIYPNPGNGEFTVSSESDKDLALISELGQVIRYIRLSQQNDHKVVVDNLAHGVYFMVAVKDPLYFSRKIIVIR